MKSIALICFIFIVGLQRYGGERCDCVGLALSACHKSPLMLKCNQGKKRCVFDRFELSLTCNMADKEA